MATVLALIMLSLGGAAWSLGGQGGRTGKAVGGFRVYDVAPARRKEEQASRKQLSVNKEEEEEEEAALLSHASATACRRRESHEA